jgi:hypothetical protein
MTQSGPETMDTIMQFNTRQRGPRTKDKEAESWNDLRRRETWLACEMRPYGFMTRLILRL